MTERPEYPPSPVPSDEHLDPGELPFTAFGQFGEGQMDNRVFDQEVYWVDVHGSPHLLEEMDEEYRRNVIAHLLVHSDYFYLHAQIRLLVGMARDLAVGRISGDVLARLTGDRIEDVGAIAWLEFTPLMRRLRALTPDAPHLDVDRVLDQD